MVLAATSSFSIGDVKVGGQNPLFLIAGPCVIEDAASCLDLAGRLAELAKKEGIALIFKASYDKANRSSLKGFRGVGLAAGLEVLAEVKRRYGLPILTDVHSPMDAAIVAEVADVLQLPAFLCRQTDLVVALGETGKVVNLKKGQFLAPWDMRNVVAKVENTGNKQIILTERGVCFGYNNLVVDMRSLPIMRDLGYPVVFDATHSLQKPGGAQEYTTGDRQWVPVLARAAVAAGCDGVFMETHVEPEKALSDKDNTVRFEDLRGIWRQLRALAGVVRQVEE